MTPAGITAMSVYFPRAVRDNTWWRTAAPSFLAALAERTSAQVWEGDGDLNPWQAAMAPYLGDLFRGTRERRVLGDGESARTLEVEAARRALDAAGLQPDDIDLVLVSCLFPDQYVVGDAIGLAAAMGFRCPCYNVESACGVATADLVMACAMVETGRARRVLIITACTYSRSAHADNPMSLTSGDGAAAFVIGPVAEGHGLLGTKSFTTLESATAFDYDIEPDPHQRYRIQMRANRDAGRALETCALKYLPAACHGALAASGLGVGDVDFAVFPTPTAWFAEFGRSMLGLSADQTIDTYPRFANTGPVLLPQNLYFALAEGRVRAGDTVLLFSLGSMSTCGAAVLRLGDVALAPWDEGAR